MLKQLQRIDFFPKTVEELRVRTFSGGALSLIALGLFFFLAFTEFFYIYMGVEIEKEFYVDEGLSRKLTINLDITFPALPCSYISLDAVDSSGESIVDIENDIFQERLNKRGKIISKAEAAQMEADIMKSVEKVPIPQNGNGCGSCYGAETDLYPCCETCADVRAAYRDKGWAFSNAKDVAQCKNEGYSTKMKSQKDEGCRLFGSVSVAKVAGNFHIAPGRSIKNSHGHSHDTAAMAFSDKFNTTHIIHSLSFGEEYEGRLDPLDGHSARSDDKTGLYQYFIKIVPTTIVKYYGDVIRTNQYSVTTHYRALNSAHDTEKLPGIFFMYDLSPVEVVLRENSLPFSDFLTDIFGLAGGLFTISMLIDWFLYRGARQIKETVLSKKSG